MVIGILTLAVDGSAVTFGTAKRGLGGSLKQLHWLPVPYRLQFKIATLMHMVYHRHCPQYLVNMVSFMSDAAHTDYNLKSLHSCTWSTIVIAPSILSTWSVSCQMRQEDAYVPQRQGRQVQFVLARTLEDERLQLCVWNSLGLPSSLRLRQL